MRKFSLILALALVPISSQVLARDIAETARNARIFNTLLTAAQLAGLLDDLKGPGPLTVFAPTDAAFARLPSGTVEALVHPGNRKKLAAIIAYHVVPGRILAAQVPTTPTDIESLNLSDAEIRAVRRQGSVFVNGVRVQQADIRADNGVIHVIGQVLWPGERR